MAVTRSLRTARHLQLYRGCCPVYIESKFVTKNIIFVQFIVRFVLLGPRGECNRLIDLFRFFLLVFFVDSRFC